VVSQELLDILRCPNCVREGPDSGLLDRQGNWLICTSCDRKYPIRDDIPVMLIEEGDRFREVPRDELPDIPPPEERMPVAAALAAPAPMDDRRKLFTLLAGLVVGVLVFLVVVKLISDQEER
jgi:uncharacterized protein YbaR (Trm112 family)